MALSIERKVSRPFSLGTNVRLKSRNCCSHLKRTEVWDSYSCPSYEAPVFTYATFPSMKMITCSANLMDYGKITLLAVKKLGEGSAPKDAWNSAVAAIKGKPSKPCARATFIGLCFVFGGHCEGLPRASRQIHDENRDYAIKGLLHLQSPPRA